MATTVVLKFKKAFDSRGFPTLPGGDRFRLPQKEKELRDMKLDEAADKKAGCDQGYWTSPQAPFPSVYVPCYQVNPQQWRAPGVPQIVSFPATASHFSGISSPQRKGV